MSKKIKYIVAAVLAAVVCAAVIFTINRKKSGINMNVGELSGDEQNYWNPDIHSISKAENGYYYLHYDGKNLLVKYFDESSKRSVPVCAKAECSHNSKTCNAWLDTDEYLSSPIYYYKNNIYQYLRLAIRNAQYIDIEYNELIEDFSKIYNNELQTKKEE